jgi:hypothetical protein
VDEFDFHWHGLNPTCRLKQLVLDGEIEKGAEVIAVPVEADGHRRADYDLQFFFVDHSSRDRRPFWDKHDYQAYLERLIRYLGKTSERRRIDFTGARIKDETISEKEEFRAQNSTERSPYTPQTRRPWMSRDYLSDDRRKTAIRRYQTEWMTSNHQVRWDCH